MESSKIAVIDIGSNSFHMMIGGYINQLYYQVTDDVKVNVKLGEGLNETGMISKDRMDFGIQTLIMYAHICRGQGLERVITVATEAVRRASNGDEFVRRAKEEAGLDVVIIPGTMEAELDYLGCVNSMEIENAVMMDIGGRARSSCSSKTERTPPPSAFRSDRSRFLKSSAWKGRSARKI